MVEQAGGPLGNVAELLKTSKYWNDILLFISVY